MSLISVLAPDYEASRPTRVEPAARTPLTEHAVITVIDNGKPNAKRLLTLVAESLKETLPIARVDVHSKPGAGQPIDPDEAYRIAARSRLVITGLGD